MYILYIYICTYLYIQGTWKVDRIDGSIHHWKWFFNSDFPTFSFPMSHQFAWNPQRIHTRGTGAWVVAVAPRETLTPKKMKAKKKNVSLCFASMKVTNITQKRKEKPILVSSHLQQSHLICWFMILDEVLHPKIWRTLGTVKVSCLPQRTWANLVSMDVHPFEILWLPIPRS